MAGENFNEANGAPRLDSHHGRQADSLDGSLIPMTECFTPSRSVILNTT